jgi:hypothetical protein
LPKYPPAAGGGAEQGLHHKPDENLTIECEIAFIPGLLQSKPSSAGAIKQILGLEGSLPTVTSFDQEDIVDTGIAVSAHQLLGPITGVAVRWPLGKPDALEKYPS